MARLEKRGRLPATEAKKCGTRQTVTEVSPVMTKRCTVSDLSQLVQELGAFDKEFAGHVRDGIAAFNVPESRRAK